MNYTDAMLPAIGGWLVKITPRFVRDRTSAARLVASPRTHPSFRQPAIFPRQRYAYTRDEKTQSWIQMEYCSQSLFIQQETLSINSNLLASVIICPSLPLEILDLDRILRP